MDSFDGAHDAKRFTIRFVFRRAWMSAVVVLTAIAAAAGAADATAQSQKDDAARREVRAMHWATGTQPLGQSHGRFTVPNGSVMVTGPEASRVDELVNGTSESDSEGIVRLRGRRLLYLAYNDSGYVTADDWNKVDAVKMLADMKKSTEDGNADRAQKGADPMFVDGWGEKPTYDAKRKSVLWIVDLHGPSGSFVNSVALVLGRKGYERFTLASDGKDPAGDAAALKLASKDFRFDRGWRFSDYVSGDKLAGYGIAALVGTAAGATLVKTGGFVAVLLLFKKFAIVIIAAIASGFGWLKRAFARRRTKFGPPDAGAPPAALS